MDEMGRQDIKKDNATVIRTDEGCWSVTQWAPPLYTFSLTDCCPGCPPLVLEITSLFHLLPYLPYLGICRMSMYHAAESDSLQWPPVEYTNKVH